MKGYKVTDCHRATYRKTDVLPPIGVWTKEKPNLAWAELCSDEVWHIARYPIGAYGSWLPCGDRTARYLWEVEAWGYLAGGRWGEKKGYRRIRLVRLVGIVTERIADEAEDYAWNSADRSERFLALAAEKLARLQRGPEGKRIRRLTRKVKDD